MRWTWPAGIFKRPPAQVARDLRSAVLRSQRTKGSKFQSAMSMLNLYVNRAGRTLPKVERARLEAAREDLRKVFDRPTGGRSRRVVVRRATVATGRHTRPRRR